MTQIEEQISMEDSAAVEWLCEEPLYGSGTGQVKTDIINEACAMIVQNIIVEC